MARDQGQGRANVRGIYEMPGGVGTRRRSEADEAGLGRGHGHGERAVAECHSGGPRYIGDSLADGFGAMTSTAFSTGSRGRRCRPSPDPPPRRRSRVAANARADPVRLHGQHLPLADRRGGDARARRARPGSRTQSRSTAPAPAAGTSATRPTRARDRGRAARGIARRGRGAPGRRARDFERFDLLLAMDALERRATCARSRPTTTARRRCGCCASSTPPRRRAGDLDVPDPYYGGDDGFDHVLDLVEAACAGLLDELARACRRCVSALAAALAPSGRRAAARRAAATSTTPTRASSTDGARVFVKTAPDAAPGAFAAEAAGLRWLARPRRAARCPRCSPSPTSRLRLLALEWIERGRLGAAATASSSAAAWRRCTRPARRRFGGAREPCLGPLDAAQRAAPRWPTFYAERRLLPLARIAAERGALPPARRRASSALIGRLDDLAGPPEPPARLHGDLWGGNVLAGARRPAVADRPGRLRRPPRGRPGDAAAVRRARRARASPPTRRSRRSRRGHEERVVLWQLLPLLAHAALFGGGWGASAAQAIRRYVG